MLAPMASEIANLSGLTGGERALDLATGTGIIARELAQLTDHVVGADISLGVLEKAQGLSGKGISLAASDAHRLPFRNRVFDLVSCGLSLSHFFLNVTAALREIQRVLRPGGRFINSAWGTEGESPTKTAAIEVRNKYLEDRELTFEGAFGEDVWAVVELGTETLRRVGFEDIEVKTSRLSGEHASQSDALNVALAWPITRYRISRLGPDDQRKLKEETAAAIRELDDLHWFSELHYYQANSRGE
jgi:SAM-dependent methyltransferase